MRCHAHQGQIRTQGSQLVELLLLFRHVAVVHIEQLQGRLHLFCNSTDGLEVKLRAYKPHKAATASQREDHRCSLVMQESPVRVPSCASRSVRVHSCQIQHLA